MAGSAGGVHDGRSGHGARDSTQGSYCLALCLHTRSPFLDLLCVVVQNTQVACLLQVPDDVMGLTVTAGGTSLPNLFASVIVAKQGLGNMAVSNAFGSNTFNIFVALALPWLIGTINDGGSYHVAKGKIFSSIMALSCVLLCFLATLAANRLTLTPREFVANNKRRFCFFCFCASALLHLVSDGLCLAVCDFCRC
jgi:Ca2+/Na+ antiporter